MTEDLGMTVVMIASIAWIWGWLKLAVKVAAKEAQSDRKVDWRLKKGYIDY